MLEICPDEIKEFSELKVFNKVEIENMRKQEIEISCIGKVELDSDEKAILRLPPKFAIRRNLEELNMKTSWD